MAELKVVTREPGAISFNYEELKAEIEAKAKEYEVSVYTEDRIADAKKDRAKLNKLKTALNDERLKREREFMLPFAEFKAQVADLIKIIDKPIAAIDTQIKDFEKAEKQEKMEVCLDIFSKLPHPDWLGMAMIESPKWYNKSTSLEQIKTDMVGTIGDIETNLAIIESASVDATVSLEYYKRTLNLKDALEEAKRYKEIEAKKASASALIEDDNEEAEWISFRALLTTRTAKMLAGWLKLNGIKFEKGE